MSSLVDCRLAGGGGGTDGSVLDNLRVGGGGTLVGVCCCCAFESLSESTFRMLLSNAEGSEGFCGGLFVDVEGTAGGPGGGGAAMRLELL